MPKELEDRVATLKAKGVPEDQAYAIATKQLQKAGVLKKGTQTKATNNTKGRKR